MFALVYLQRKKSESSSNMVSIGIQNESGVHSISSVTPKKKVKTKTIILMDAAIQTGTVLYTCTDRYSTFTYTDRYSTYTCSHYSNTQSHHSNTQSVVVAMQRKQNI